MSTAEDRASGAGGMAEQQAAGGLGSEVREGYAEIGGVRLHYVEAGEGPLVVLLHGFPEFWYGLRLHVEAQIRPISAPTLVIWGQDDRYLSQELPEPDHDDVPGLDRVERLPGASHWVHHHERVNQLLIDFFTRALPAKDPGQVTIPRPSTPLAPQT
jgi:pimeloyl-ACP methyl ester carboxylesterase